MPIPSTFTSHAPPRLASPAERLDAGLERVREAIGTVARAARLGRDGIEALTRWTCWIAYASDYGHDPHLRKLPGWSAVLPIDTYRAADNLMRVLLRAGESPATARAAAGIAYGQETFLREPFLPSWRYGELLPGGAEKLPACAIGFGCLPRWARSMALSAANLAGKRLAGMPGLDRLDLRWLRGYYTDFSGCAPVDCDFSDADLRGANLRLTTRSQNRFDRAITGWDRPLAHRAYLAASDRDAAAPDDTGSSRPARYSVASRDLPCFLADDEILQVLPFAKVEQVDGVEVGYTDDGKAVIQQRYTENCHAAIAAMLIADHGGPIDTEALRARDRGYRLQTAHDIDHAGLKAVLPIVRSIPELVQELERNGSAEVGLDDPQLGLHSVIVDEIDPAHALAKLRDPFHGWALVVPLDALASRLRPATVIIQARPRDPAQAETAWIPDPRTKA